MSDDRSAIAKDRPAGDDPKSRRRLYMRRKVCRFCSDKDL